LADVPIELTLSPGRHQGLPVREELELLIPIERSAGQYDGWRLVWFAEWVSIRCTGSVSFPPITQRV
jgi:hypothetical protein